MTAASKARSTGDPVQTNPPTEKAISIPFAQLLGDTVGVWWETCTSPCTVADPRLPRADTVQQPGVGKVNPVGRGPGKSFLVGQPDTSCSQ